MKLGHGGSSRAPLTRWVQIIGPLLAASVILAQWNKTDWNWVAWSEPRWLWFQLILAPVVFGLEAQLWRSATAPSGFSNSTLVSLRNTAVYAFYQLFLPAPAGEYAARLGPLAARDRSRAAQILLGLQAIKWQARLGLGGACTLGIGLFLKLPAAVGLLGGASLLASFALGILIARGRRQSLPRWIPERWFPERSWPDIPHGLLLGVSVFKGLMYALSFALFLKSMGGCAPLWIDWGAATAQYTLASLIPSWGWTEGLVLGGAGVLAFDVLGCSVTAVLQASVLCWLLHTALPGVLGSVWAGREMRLMGRT